jgi:hypothetical protein
VRPSAISPLKHPEGPEHVQVNLRAVAIAQRNETHAIDVHWCQVREYSADRLRDRCAAGLDVNDAVSGIQEAVVPA